MLERRSLGGLEIRAAREGNEIVIEGYGAVFDAPYDVYDFVEEVAPGAFRRTLRENKDILSMFNHDPNFLLGRSGNGTAEFREDAKGLHYRARADADDPQSLSVLRKIERGDVSGSSMAFFVRRDGWDKSRPPYKRTLLELELVEAGPVVLPASPTTSTGIAARKSGVLDFDIDLLEAAVLKKRAGLQITGAEADACSRFAAEMRGDTVSLVEHALGLRRRWLATLQ